MDRSGREELKLTVHDLKKEILKIIVPECYHLEYCGKVDFIEEFF